MNLSLLLPRQRSRHRARLRLGRCSASSQRDAQGRITATDTSYGKAGGTPITFHTEQGHNADGQPASLTYPDGSQQSCTYQKGQRAAITMHGMRE